MPETTAILVAAGLLAIEFLLFRWLLAHDKNAPMRFVATASVGLFIGIGMFGTATVHAAMDDFGKRGPAGQAIGWSNYTEPVTSFGGSKVLMVTTTNHTVEVPANTVIHQGDVIAFSCPPATDKSWSYTTTPACKHSSTVVNCAKGCVPYMAFAWWWMPMTAMNFIIALWPVFTVWRRDRTARTN